MGRYIKHALVDQGLRLLAAVVSEAVVPHWDQIFGVFLGNLGERTEPLQIIPHAVVEYVRSIARSLD